MSYYKGNEQRCKDYNAMVSGYEEYKDTTSGWGEVQYVDGSYYIEKHPEYVGAYLTEVEEMPEIQGGI